MRGTPAPPTGRRFGSTLRSQSGAFDLTSVLVGSTVVAILVGGVATNGFGVIPWAQDNAARQELDAIRTAQGAAKVREGRFSNNAALGTSGYLQGAGQVATASDDDGSCYAGVSKSATDKLYITTDTATTPVEFSSSAQQTCVSTLQMMSLVGAVQGDWPSGTSGSGANFTPFSATNGHPQRAINMLNAEMGLEGSEVNYRAYAENTDEAWAAWDTADATTAYNSQYYDIIANVEDYIGYQQMLNSPEADVTAARGAMRTASNGFYWDPTTANQQAYIDAMHSYFNTAVNHAPKPLIPDASFTPVPVTPGAEREARWANARLAYVSSSLPMYFRYGHYNQWSAWPIWTAWEATPAGVEWNTVMGDPRGLQMTDRKDSGIPELWANAVAKLNDYEGSATGKTLEQLATKRQECIDALQAFFAVATVPAP